MADNEIANWLIRTADVHGVGKPVDTFRFHGQLPMMLRFQSAMIYNLDHDMRRKSFHDDPNLSIKDIDIDSVPAVDKRWMQTRHYAPAILTKDEAVALAANRGRRYETYSSLKENAFSFVNDYCYSQNRVDGALPSHWVASSFSLPLDVKPREGLEDGVVSNIDAYMFIFERGLLIESEDELNAILERR